MYPFIFSFFNFILLFLDILLTSNPKNLIEICGHDLSKCKNFQEVWILLGNEAILSRNTPVSKVEMKKTATVPSWLVLDEIQKCMGCYINQLTSMAIHLKYLNEEKCIL